MKTKEKEGTHESQSEASDVHPPRSAPPAVTGNRRLRTCVLPRPHRGRERWKGFIQVGSACIHLKND